jgi:protein arginine kinase activator
MYGFICSVCNKKPAARKVVTFNSEKKKIQYLCEDCYYLRQKEMTISIMDNIASKTTGKTNSAGGVKYQNVCSKCNTTEAEFRKTGLLGCENCYNDLAPAILSMIRSSQGNLSHTGKDPNLTASKKNEDTNKTKPEENEQKVEVKQKDSEALTLKKQLENAIMIEDFELACKLRDKINNLKKEDMSDA